MNHNWKDVSKKHPCIVCGKPDWCARSGDVVRCMRPGNTPAGWRVVKECPDGGTVYRPENTKQPKATIPWSKRAARFTEALRPDRLTALAGELGVSADSLAAVGVGWNGSGKCWTFPERNGAGDVIGINRRFEDGAKKAVQGSKRGLTIPSGFTDHAADEAVLVVEGASDTAALLTMGLLVIGRPSNSGGAVHLAALLRDHGDVIIIGENDLKDDGQWPGRDGAARVAAHLAREWRRPVTYAMPPDGTKDARAWLCDQRLDLEDADACRSAGGRLLELLRSNTTTVSPGAAEDDRPNGIPYAETPKGLVWFRPSGDGYVKTWLTNFHTRIVADTIRDDGQESANTFDLEAKVCGTSLPSHFQIPAARFAGLSWVHEQLGARAILYPGFANKDHTRAAIQMLSCDLITRRIFTHTGWRKIGDDHVYLHGGGAIGPNGPMGGIEVELHSALELFSIPDPVSGDELRSAVKASLSILDLAPDRLTFPLLASVYRSVIGPADFS